MRTTLSVVTLLLAACGPRGSDTDSAGGRDADGDGYAAPADCDDGDPAVYPGAPEHCDDVDEDCDGDVDEDAVDANTYYLDADEDGFGGTSRTEEACHAPDGYRTQADDCDDLDSTVSPINDEVCDGIDNDCDGLVDDDDDSVDAATYETWWLDADGDGYGTPDETTLACAVPEGYADNSADCDDADPDRNPDTIWYVDTDRDGYGSASFSTRGCKMPDGYVALGTDCDDTDETVNPDATEVCNGGTDDDCNGKSDDDDPGVEDRLTWYADEDGDGYGDDDTATETCDPEAGLALIPGDCDDGEVTVNAGEDEICYDLMDNNCDGLEDEACYMKVSTADLEIVGDSTGDYFGYQVASGGDVDGDGVEDLVVGAYGQDAGGSNAGAAYLFRGPLTAGSRYATTADVTFTGSAASDYFGHSLGLAGDFNGDGGAEVLVGAFGADEGGSSSGTVYFFADTVATTLGADSADYRVYGSATNDYMGMYDPGVSGDLDDDGELDFVVGAYGDDTTASAAGAIYVIYGPLTTSASTDEAGTVIVGASASDNVGLQYEVADRDGDGYEDILSGVPGSDRVRVFDGPFSPGETLALSDYDAGVAGVSGDGFGSHLVVDDYDGDGRADLAIGAKYWSDAGYVEGGAIYVVPGTEVTTGSVAAASAAAFIAYEHGDDRLLGGHYQGLDSGDVDGNGAADLVLGSYLNSDVYTQNGAAFLFYGAMSGSADVEDADLVILGEADNEWMGYGVTLGDLDGDGRDDVVVGVRGYGGNVGHIGVWFASGL